MSCVAENHHNQHPGKTDIPVIEHLHPSFKRACSTFFIIAALSLTATACSVSSGDGVSSAKDELVTGSVTKPVQAEGIGSQDAEIIKSVVAKSDENNLLAWQNPESGNKGTITAIDNFVGSHGQQCKKFQTTVDTFMGISLYNGETCELKKGFWVLSWFLREESQTN